MRIPILLLLVLHLGAQEDARRIAPVAPGRRLALVIGNQSYARKPLRNPRADARSMADLLRGDLAFTDVRTLEDGNLVGMQRAIREFVREVRPGDLALFYYSGHGMQVAGNNWMIPVDFHAEFEDDVPDQAYPAQRVLKELEEAGASVRILILDACRDNPLPAAGRRSGKDGLVAMNGAEGTYVLFATAENSTASDNPRGANGLFTGYLVEAMRRPGLTLDQAFKETRREVSAATGGKQRPWLATDIDQDLVLRPVGAAPGTPAPALNAAAETWELIKDSRDPQVFEDFAKSYPNSDLAPGARIRAGELRRAAAPTVARVEPPRLPETQAAPAIRTKVNGKDGLTYVLIPPGTFIMGCSPGDSKCDKDEKPAHEVTITKAFWIGQTEVTQEAYQRVMGTNPSRFHGAKLPVEEVSWNDAVAFCQASGMRLPTEAEWEYAARAGSTGSRYGDPEQVAWYNGNSGSQTHEVAQKQPNAWGLYDMLGNVWEWTADWYARYSDGSQSDPRGPTSGQSRTLRGGSWDLDPRYVRASDRYRFGPVYRSTYIGLRCAGN